MCERASPVYTVTGGGGAAPRSGGAAPRSGGAAPRSGGAAPRSGGLHVSSSRGARASRAPCPGRAAGTARPVAAHHAHAAPIEVGPVEGPAQLHAAQHAHQAGRVSVALLVPTARFAATDGQIGRSLRFRPQGSRQPTVRSGDLCGFDRKVRGNRRPDHSILAVPRGMRWPRAAQLPAGALRPGGSAATGSGLLAAPRSRPRLPRGVGDQAARRRSGLVAAEPGCDGRIRSRTLHSVRDHRGCHASSAAAGRAYRAMPRMLGTMRADCPGMRDPTRSTPLFPSDCPSPRRPA
jgi:hypothetical protein